MHYYKKINNGKTIIAGVGSALVDILSHETDETLSEIGGAKGGMTLVDSFFIDDALKKMKSKPVYAPGGAACNTINGIGKLGAKTKFLAKNANDDIGRFFEKGLMSSGVETFLFKSSTPTGRVLSIITDDAQRTMFTYLGASAELKPEEITEECFDDCAVLFIEGYLLFNRSLILKALDCAKNSGCVIALDLASFTVVEASKDILGDLISDYVDILIANEDEAKYYSGVENELESLRIMKNKVDIAVLKLGKRGSLISFEDKIMEIEPIGGGPVLDTTGAGDLWASGFLYGLFNGFDIQKAGNLASLCGYEVCNVDGAVIPEDGWKRIKESNYYS